MKDNHESCGKGIPSRSAGGGGLRRGGLGYRCAGLNPFGHPDEHGGRDVPALFENLVRQAETHGQ